MKKIKIILIMLVVFVSALSAQQTQPADTNRTTGAQAGSNVIDLTQLGKTYTISARMELPQVKIFDKRITPDFKAVTAEKSFESELKTDSEVINYEPITSGKVEPIKDIKALLNKKRF